MTRFFKAFLFLAVMLAVGLTEAWLWIRFIIVPLRSKSPQVQEFCALLALVLLFFIFKMKANWEKSNEA